MHLAFAFVIEGLALLKPSPCTPSPPPADQFVVVNGVRLHYLEWSASGTTGYDTQPSLKTSVRFWTPRQLSG
jgi:hypothetical protein